MARVLGVIRLSRETDESTSAVRQRAYIEAWAQSGNHEIVGWAEDLDVSASIAPWKRPELSKWLPATIGQDVSKDQHRAAYAASRAGEWDIAVAWKLDRIARRVLHLATLIDWCLAEGKTLASTAEGFDITSPMGRIFVGILGALAEGELEAIKERSRSSFKHLMKQGRWRGGAVPYGYISAKAAKGDGWRLDIDPGAAEVIRDAAKRITAGESINSVCRALNDDKMLAPLDRQRVNSGKEPKGSPWRVGNLQRTLRSHTLLGHAEMTETIKGTDGKPEKVTRIVRGENGLPLQRAEPILTPEEFTALQAAIDSRTYRQSEEKAAPSLLLQIGFCGVCGSPLYRVKGRSALYYRCGSVSLYGNKCGNRTIRADELDEKVARNFLGHVGNSEVMRKTFVPGRNNAVELDNVNAALAELREDRAAGLYRGERGTAEFRDMAGRLEDQREALEALPSEPDRWLTESTGQTYAELWEALPGAAERNVELRDSGLRVFLFPEALVDMPDLPAKAAEGYSAPLLLTVNQDPEELERFCFSWRGASELFAFMNRGRQ